jgi:hypothetical protein
MKTRKDIQSLLDYLHKLNEDNFSGLLDNTNLDDMKYTSPITVDDDGKPEIIDGNEAYTILGSVLSTIRALEWVLEEGVAYRYVKDEQEAKRYEHKIMYDGNGRELIPDTSVETFLAGIEGHW